MATKVVVRFRGRNIWVREERRKRRRVVRLET